MSPKTARSLARVIYEIIITRGGSCDVRWERPPFSSQKYGLYAYLPARGRMSVRFIKYTLKMSRGDFFNISNDPARASEIEIYT